ncbi:glycosyltransferase family 4 protein [Methylobacterium sp. CM6247]
MPDFLDGLLGLVTRTTPLWWALARRLRREAKPGDVVFCTGEDVGVPVAALCGAMHDVRIAMMVHYVDRPKGRLAFWLFGLKKKVWLFFAVSKPQARFLTQFVDNCNGRVRFIRDQTDTNFFYPGPISLGKLRPIIASVGLEQRDYSTLAAATAELDVDVRISGFSADTRLLSRAFPRIIPTNMDRRFYPWPELVQLYRDADVIVVSLFQNNYAAGIQAFMEALACGRPIVVTRSQGLEGYLEETDAMRVVPPSDPVAMRDAIVDLLAKPKESTEMGERAAELARERHRLERYVDNIVGALRDMREL